MNAINVLETVIFLTLLLLSAVTDIKKRIIPNIFIILIAANTFLFRTIEIICREEKSAEIKSLVVSFGSAVAVFVFLLIFISLADKIACCETMGGGDIKLISAIVLFFGIPKGIIAIFLSCISGLILHAIVKATQNIPHSEKQKSKSENNDIQDKTFPFAPAVFTASFITVLCGDFISSWYMALFL